MENFLIGQHGSFDEKKQVRDYRSSFFGIEACMLESETDIAQLEKIKREEGAKLGIHFPLRAGQWEHRDPQYLSNSVKMREASYAYMEQEFEYASKLEPEYILVHYPKPVVLDSHVDWFGWKWRFGHSSEYVAVEDMPFDIFKARSEAFFSWFAEQAETYRFKPVIELDAIPCYLTETGYLAELLDRYPTIELCVDIGRFHLQESIDDQFDSFKFLRELNDRIKEVHLWNIQVTDRVANSHYPALPSLKSEEGWADIEKYFEILREKEQPFRILFEHNSKMISKTELNDCYQWIENLCKPSNQKKG